MEQKGIEPREIKETGEAKETPEARKLDDATFEPQALVEQSGGYKQAEAIQENFTAVVQNAAVSPEAVRIDPIPMPNVAGTEVGQKAPGGAEAARLGGKQSGGEKVAFDPVPIPNVAGAEAVRQGGKVPGGVEAVPVNAGEVVAKFSTEQKQIYDQFSKEDQKALIRMIGQSQEINPAKMKGRSGGIIY